MSISPVKLSITAFALASIAHAAFIPPGQLIAPGLTTVADFDWGVTNVKNNLSYFNDDSNFFNGRDLVFDQNNHDFLDAIRGGLTDKPTGRERKSAALVSAGFNNYNNFGVAETFTVGRNTSFSGVGVDTGRGVEKFEIFGADNEESQKTITLQVREKSQSEKFGFHSYAHHHSSNTVIGHSPLVSNVMRIHGMGIQATSSDGRTKTKPFALEATYNQSDFDNTYSLTELEELINGCLFLGWLNTAIDGNPNDITGDDRWVHAVQGNFDNMPTNPNRHDEHGVIGNAYIGTLQEYIDGTQTSVPGLSKLAGEIRPGDHGGDPDSNTVWAIVDHNSDFAVVPESSTYALFAGVLALATVFFRRRK
tara:strand:+ start:1060 stop:2151 length:1092 start_codon:yes stop_codon:yes gene_type:complete